MNRVDILCQGKVSETFRITSCPPLPVTVGRKHYSCGRLDDTLASMTEKLCDFGEGRLCNFFPLELWEKGILASVEVRDYLLEGLHYCAVNIPQLK